MAITLKSLDLKTEATKTLYAGAGAVDLAVETVRESVTEYVADVQKKIAEVQADVLTRVADVQKAVQGIDLEPKKVRAQATTVVNTRVETLTDEAKARRAAIEARVAELQAQATALPTKVQSALTENVATATAAYDDLAKRGEVVVARLRKQELAQEAAKVVEDAAEVAKAPAKKAPAKKAAAKKAPAKKAPAKKAPAKKAAAKKAPAKKAPAKKAAPVVEAAAEVIPGIDA
ncbi:hypothetical protein GCM10022215_04300 [Nocardioides fonticola]|uniref:Heparin binding hemagglutinin HbhA n=1 Tax=Nocardioides fonticola TaxID=450363 RepID=A0ABP7XAS4_9ACTN